MSDPAEFDRASDVVVDPSHPFEDRAMKIFFMADHLGHRDGRVHGGTTYFINVLGLMRDFGFDVVPVFLGPWHPAADRLEAAGVHAHFLGTHKTDPRGLPRAAALLQREGGDVMHLHSFKSHLVGRYLGNRRRIPSIVHVHDNIEIPGPIRPLQRWFGPTTAALVGITEAVTRFGARQYSVPSERCRTVRHGIRLDRFRNQPPGTRAAIRGAIGTPEDAFVVSVAGRLDPVKGQPELFRAMKKVFAERQNVELWVVGEGDARPEYEAQVRKLGIDGKVRFLGQRDDMPAMLAAVDLVAVPSMWDEGFGLVALEASAAGRPTVAFYSEGLAEIVRDGMNGLIVTKGDIDELAAAILGLIDDPSRHASFASAAVEISREFAYEPHLSAMAEIYRDAIVHGPAFLQRRKIMRPG